MLRYAELVAGLGGGLGGEVGVEAGIAEAGSVEAGRLVVQAEEGYVRGGCAAGQQSLSGPMYSNRRHC